MKEAHRWIITAFVILSIGMNSRFGLNSLDKVRTFGEYIRFQYGICMAFGMGYHTTPTTVQNVRTSYANSGLEATIARKKRETPPVPPKVTGDVEAHIIALACGDPPEGYEKWTLRLLADKCVELNYAESLSHMTVSRILKNEFKPHLKKCWCT